MFFLVAGAVVFLIFLALPAARRFALSAALWCAVWGPCAIAFQMLAGLSLAADALAAKGWGHDMVMPPLPAWRIYAVLALVGTAMAATVAAIAAPDAHRKDDVCAVSDLCDGCARGDWWRLRLDVIDLVLDPRRRSLPMASGGGGIHRTSAVLWVCGLPMGTPTAWRTPDTDAMGHDGGVRGSNFLVVRHAERKLSERHISHLSSQKARGEMGHPSPGAGRNL
jgi:hypothetical protein